MRVHLAGAPIERVSRFGLAWLEAADRRLITHQARKLLLGRDKHRRCVSLDEQIVDASEKLKPLLPPSLAIQIFREIPSRPQAQIGRAHV